MKSESTDNCKEYKILLVKKTDGEISPREEAGLIKHLRNCPECQKELQNFQKLKEETMEMKKHFLPEEAWKDYWRRLYNRLERGLSWILVSVGAIILLVYAIYNFVMETLNASDLPGIIKFSILAVVLGGVILLVSVIREKLILRRHDKYKEVQR
jgi:predicted anti-sigma-YlaC factor YlaD